MHNNLLGIQNINEKHQGKRPFGELGMERWKILKWILEKVYEGGNWIELAENTLHWRTLINPVMNLRISKSKAFIDR